MKTNETTVKYNKTTMWKYKEYLASYLFILPALLLFVIFVVVPMIKGIYVSFFKDTLSGSTFVGVDNYIKIFTEPVFRFKQSLINTLIIAVFTVPGIIFFSLFIAVNIYKRNTITRSFVRGAFYLPTVSSIVSIALVWNWIFHPGYGILNYLLAYEGTDVIAWLADARYAMPLLIFVLLTVSVGQPIIIYIASLGNIPAAHLEAASIDGAGGFRQFIYIIWPMLLPTTLYIVIISTINAFGCFSLVQLLTNGGPYYSTTTIMYQIYQYGFQLGEYGISGALGVLLGAIIMIISAIQYKYFGSDIEY